MNDLKDGGPAFPGEPDTWTPEGHQTQFAGMTLRDYFAAKALQGICAHHDTWGLMLHKMADAAYEAADAMLRAREN